MATPTADEIAALITEIRGLKNKLDEASARNTKIVAQSDAATRDLLTATGDFDPAAWNNLNADAQAKRWADLDQLKQSLTKAIVTDDIEVEPGSIMYRKVASNGWILFLTAFALIGVMTDLSIICYRWTEATSGKTIKPDEASQSMVSAQDQSSPATPSATIRSQGTTTPASTTASVAQPSASPTEAATRTPGPPAAKASPSVSPAGRMVQTTTGANKPSEGMVLAMVMLLGGLGGFLRLASSMANYVGNRQLLQSWIIYYILTPFQGAALAPVVYLLLRVGVLNPANPSPGASSPTDSLNLIGIYAFAALTGLFSKQAIETMADVFSTIFKRMETKDALDKTKPEKEKQKDKG